MRPVVTHSLCVCVFVQSSTSLVVSHNSMLKSNRISNKGKEVIQAPYHTLHVNKFSLTGENVIHGSVCNSHDPLSFYPQW